jgi:hypothetical protein
MKDKDRLLKAAREKDLSIRLILKDSFIIIRDLRLQKTVENKFSVCGRRGTCGRGRVNKWRLR